MNKLKILVLSAFLTVCAHASVMYTLTIDLTQVHPGSVLSGSTTLATAIALGGSTQLSLSFTDPADYSPTSLTTTLSLTNGTTGDAVRFSTLIFTNLATNKTFNLAVSGAAQCAVDVPCQASGRYQINDPPLFTGTYSITAATIPEPGYTLLLAALGTCLFLGRRRLRRQ